ncbi:uncharacterized protein LOC129228177 [Uloborus diversus]|uniref:uncharacterized protein LOC129228177 n=1 Tax=Uloborus diversus TaxID=327109 RepID=UPI002409B1F4|nr:uncharacterized protein LOC129228177 [Uloborus diversus]
MSLEDENTYGQTAVLLAATGWSIKKKESSSLKAFLTCESCQRSAWCGSFVSLKSSILESDKDNENDKTTIPKITSCNSSLTENSSDEPVVKRKRLSSTFESEPFNPFYEHRIWCLWVCTNAEKNTFTTNSKLEEVTCVPGFKIFLKSLLRNINSSDKEKEVSSPSKEQIRSIKNLLDTWPDMQKE